MKTQITIEQLAERMSETVWTKGEVKRIYLNDAGWNTKKMSTKTFIWQDENGDFQVSVKIECPSQPWNWIKSQQDEVWENIKSQIENALEDAEGIAKQIEKTTVEQAEVSKSEMVKLSETAVIATGKQINDSGLFKHIQPSDKQVLLWIYNKMITKQGYSWMSIVEVELNQNKKHTHKVGDFYCVLPTTEKHDDYCFEKYLQKHCEITRLLEPTIEMADIRGNRLIIS